MKSAKRIRRIVQKTLGLKRAYFNSLMEPELVPKFLLAMANMAVQHLSNESVSKVLSDATGADQMELFNIYRELRSRLTDKQITELERCSNIRNIVDTMADKPKKQTKKEKQIADKEQIADILRYLHTSGDRGESNVGCN
jgi:hypothetical protein